MSEPFPWSRLIDARREFRRRRGGFWSMPVVRKSETIAAALVRPGARVLDVGAGDRGLERVLRVRAPDLAYRSVDPDPGRPHDHRGLDEVAGRFDLIACLEVIEHLQAAAAVSLLQGIRVRLAANGRLVLSTPNIMNPTAFLTTVDHRTPFAWDELGGILTLLGFSVVRMVRVQNDPVLRRVGRWCLGPLHRALSVDFARSIAVVAGVEE